MCVSHPLLDSVIGMLGSFTDDPQCIGCVVKVWRGGRQVSEVIFEQHPILGEPLHWFQKEMLKFELTTLGKLLKLLERTVWVVHKSCWPGMTAYCEICLWDPNHDSCDMISQKYKICWLVYAHTFTTFPNFGCFWQHSSKWRFIDEKSRMYTVYSLR